MTANALNIVNHCAIYAIIASNSQVLLSFNKDYIAYKLNYYNFYNIQSSNKLASIQLLSSESDNANIIILLSISAQLSQLVYFTNRAIN